ncbi:uncharacterized protein LOC129743691 [Uranotaenia lowii]|uniref:uncharacterized protein LOC129743691 n=1 Tax=Uranotaenia lowii TaxID=190385 RepID=UPI0024783A22|nr:uncharacterized protein LOC129743691 [Uranotaenia lowii]
MGALLFAGMLLFGLYKRRAELIRVYILYMKIHFGILVVLWTITGIIAIVALTISNENQVISFSSIVWLVVIIVVVLAFITAIFWLFLWILKGALKAVESLNALRTPVRNETVCMQNGQLQGISQHAVVSVEHAVPNNDRQPQHAMT